MGASSNEQERDAVRRPNWQNRAVGAEPRPFRPPAPSRASRFPSLRSKGSHRGSIVGGRWPTRIVYESKLESDVAYVMLARRDVADLWDQPPAVAYRDEAGHLRQYTFDYLVRMVDGRRIALAVKPEEKAERQKLVSLLNLIAPQIPRSFATEIALVTDQSHSRETVRDSRLIHAARREGPGPDDAAVMHVMATVAGAVGVGAIVEATGLKGRAFRAIVRRIADGDLLISDGHPITYATQVKLAAAPAGEKRQ